MHTVRWRKRGERKGRGRRRNLRLKGCAQETHEFGNVGATGSPDTVVAAEGRIEIVELVDAVPEQAHPAKGPEESDHGHGDGVGFPLEGEDEGYEGGEEGGEGDQEEAETVGIEMLDQ